MRKNRIAQLGIRQLCNHCNLDGGHNFPCVNAAGGKPEDPISRGRNQRFQESSCLRKRVRAEHLFHGNLEQSVCDAPILSLFLAEAYARKLWVCEQAEWHLPARCNVIATVEVVADNPKIVKTDVSELRPTGYVAYSPDSRRSRLKPLIDFHVSVRCQLDSGEVQANTLRVWSAT